MSEDQTKISREQVRRVAQLSRLKLSDEELAYHTTQLESILGYIDKLKQLDVEGVEPLTHPMAMTNVLREDVEATPMGVEQALANAPETEDGAFFKVTKVLGEQR